MVVGVKKTILVGLVVGFWGLGFLGTGAFAQQKSSFKVGGPCMACGAARVEGLAKGIDGVSGAMFDPAKGILTVDFNPVAASLVDIQLELSINGYDAGDFMHDAGAKLPACAGGGMRGDQAIVTDIEEPGIDDIEGLDADTDWENPDAFDVAGGTDIEDDDLDLPDDEDIDDTDLNDWADDEKEVDATPVEEEVEDDSDDL